MPKRESVGRKKKAKVKPKGAPPESSQPSALATLAAAHGISEADWMSAYQSSLKMYGQTVEDRVGEEFRPWLLKLANVIEADEHRFDALQKLMSKCDVLLLMPDLYLFTYPEESQRAKKRTAADAFKDSCRYLKELDKLVPRYATLHKRTSKVFARRKLKLLRVVLSKEVSALFSEPATFIDIAQQQLKGMRQWAGKMASLKTDINDVYLWLMAARLRESTGEYHMTELATLVEVALAAHGEQDKADEDMLKQRVQRYAKRMNIPRHKSGAAKKE